MPDHHRSRRALTLSCPPPSIQAVMNFFLQPSRALITAGRLAAFLVILAFPASAADPRNTVPIANFTDIAEKAGLTMSNVFGGRTQRNTSSRPLEPALQFSIMTTMVGPTFFW